MQNKPIKPTEVRKQKYCQVVGCKKPIDNDDLCEGHYRMWNKIQSRMKHQPDCQWEKCDCSYKKTHEYCPHPEHACTCKPTPEEIEIPRKWSDLEMGQISSLALVEAMVKINEIIDTLTQLKQRMGR